MPDTKCQAHWVAMQLPVTKKGKVIHSKCSSAPARLDTAMCPAWPMPRDSREGRLQMRSSVSTSARLPGAQALWLFKCLVLAPLKHLNLYALYKVIFLFHCK